MTHTTYADLLRPSTKVSAAIYDFTLIVGASIVIALSARFAFYIGWVPVPITMQTAAVLLVGALLGSKRGALAVLTYLAEGVAGLPVFAAGQSGPIYIAGPTGGYLLGFVGAAFLTGLLAERGWDRKAVTTVAAMVLGTLLIHIPGILWLVLLMPSNSFVNALIFIPVDLAKIALAAAVLPAGWRLIGNNRRE